MEEIAGIESDAEEIGRDKAELGGAEADDADDSAVDGGNDPTLPEFLAEQDGAENGQNAGDIIQSDGVEHAGHVVRKGRSRSRKRFTGSGGRLVKFCPVDQGSCPERVSWRRAVCGTSLLPATLLFRRGDRQFGSHWRRLAEARSRLDSVCKCLCQW